MSRKSCIWINVMYNSVLHWSGHRRFLTIFRKAQKSPAQLLAEYKSTLNMDIEHETDYFGGDEPVRGQYGFLLQSG